MTGHTLLILLSSCVALACGGVTSGRCLDSSARHDALATEPGIVRNQTRLLQLGARANLTGGGSEQIHDASQSAGTIVVSDDTHAVAPEATVQNSVPSRFAQVGRHFEIVRSRFDAHAWLTSPVVIICMSSLSIVLCSSACWTRGQSFITAGATENEDDEKCKNAHLDEDTCGFAISSLVRDVSMLASGRGAFALRLFRLALSLGLLLFSMVLQFFLMMEIKLFCTSKAVHDIREAYDKYEFIMYGRNESHTTLTVHGNHRGIDHFFQPSSFAELPESLKVQICNIPLSQPSFFFVIVFIWTLTCIGEIKKVNDLFYFLVVAMPTAGSMEGSLQVDTVDDDGDGLVNEKVIVHLTRPVKLFMSCFILLPRLLMTSYLLFLGCRWLAATNDFTDLVLNAVALEFVVLLKELIYHTLVPDRNKRDVQHTEIRAPARKQPASYWVFLGTFLWGVIAVLWCLAYMFWLQRVLPEYQWDVRATCAKWLEEAIKG